MGNAQGEWVKFTFRYLNFKTELHERIISTPRR